MSDHAGHHEPTSFWTKYVFSIDHKVIGVQFLIASLFFVVIGGLLALGVRYQLAWPSQDVPYAKLLPGAMTARAPELNIALWKQGADLVFRADVQGVTTGAKGALVGWPKGFAVTLPVGTRVQESDGQLRTVSEPTNAWVDARYVMADYHYAKTDVLAAVGQTVTIGDSASPESGRQVKLLGREILVPDVTGQPQRRVKSQPVAMPLRVDATPIEVSVPAQDAPTRDGSPISARTLTATAGQFFHYKDSLTTDAYLQLFTVHATVMVFFVLMPVLMGGFGNFLIPLMIGARDMAFPRLNMLSYWIAIPSGIVILSSFWVLDGPAGGGWTMYPPLSTGAFVKPQLGTTLWVVAIGLVGFSTIVGTLNYITTIINMRAPGMTMFRMPLTIWSLLVTSVLALFATPVLTAAAIMLLFDRTLGTMFFTAAGGGQPLLWQHLFWFFGHPEVYILILPAMGITSDILATFARKPIFGYKPMVFAICAIAVLGFIVWGHHMFQSGMNPILGTSFMAATIMIAVPSAIKTFNWLGTLWGGNIQFTPPMLFALGFVSMFVIGGLSGIFMASAPVDIHIHDTYFIVAHIHYVLFGGTILAVFAGVYYWYPKMFGTQMNQKWGYAHFWMTLLGMNGTFFIMHILGIAGHPRRYASILEYPELQHLQPMNVIMTVWAIALGIAQIPFFFNFFASMPNRAGRALSSVMIGLCLAPTLVGVIFWNLFAVWAGDPGWVGGLSTLGVSLFGHTGAGTFSATQWWLGHLVAIGGMGLLLLSLLAGLPRGGKVAVVIVGGLLLLSMLMLAGAGRTIGGDAGRTLAQLLANVQVSAGLAAIVVAIVLVAWRVIWESGRRVGFLTFADRALWIVMLPLFLAPLLLKPDFFVLGGHSWLLPYRPVLMVLLCLPGLAFLVAFRPRVAYGEAAGDNPWVANSLEWATSSPPPFVNFHEIPTVYRGPYEYSSPVVREDYLPQTHKLPAGVVEPTAH